MQPDPHRQPPRPYAPGTRPARLRLAAQRPLRFGRGGCIPPPLCMPLTNHNQHNNITNESRQVLPMS